MVSWTFYQQHFFGVAAQGFCESDSSRDPHEDQDKRIPEWRQRFILELQMRSFLSCFRGRWELTRVGANSYTRGTLKKHFNCFNPAISNHGFSMEAWELWKRTGLKYSCTHSWCVFYPIKFQLNVLATAADFTCDFQSPYWPERLGSQTWGRCKTGNNHCIPRVSQCPHFPAGNGLGERIIPGKLLMCQTKGFCIRLRDQPRNKPTFTTE